MTFKDIRQTLQLRLKLNFPMDNAIHIIHYLLVDKRYFLPMGLFYHILELVYIFIPSNIKFY